MSELEERQYLQILSKSSEEQLSKALRMYVNDAQATVEEMARISRRVELLTGELDRRRAIA